jgi:hypothetical protein
MVAPGIEHGPLDLTSKPQRRSRFITFIITLPYLTLGFRSCIFRSGLPTTIFHTFQFPPFMFRILPISNRHTNLITLIIFYTDYKLLSSLRNILSKYFPLSPQSMLFPCTKREGERGGPTQSYKNTPITVFYNI